MPTADETDHVATRFAQCSPCCATKLWKYGLVGDTGIEPVTPARERKFTAFLDPPNLGARGGFVLPIGQFSTINVCRCPSFDSVKPRNF